MEKVKSFFKRFKHTWKNIRFMSFKDLMRTTLIVLLAMFFLGVCIVGLDALFGNGLKALSSINIPQVKAVQIILSIIFLLSALMLIVLETIVKPRTQGFGIATYKDSYMSKNKVKNMEYKIKKIIMINGIVCAVSALGCYLFG